MKQTLRFVLLGAAVLPLAQAHAQNVGINTATPAYPLDVNGTIHATTGQGVVLDAQDRPLITRGWDAFATGPFTGLGRWGLFMEPSSLTFGIPGTNSTLKRFQWAAYNDDSSIGQQLMTLYSNGFMALGSIGAGGVPGTRFDIVSEQGGPSDDVLLRSYGPANNPGIGIRRYRGTRTAPANLQAGDLLGELGMSGYYNGQENLFTQSGLRSYYRGSGTTANSDLKLVTSGVERVTVDPNGLVGVGNSAPVSRLDVLNDNGGNLGGDDISITTYSGATNPGIGFLMNSARGTSAAPANLLADDPLGILVFAGRGQDGTSNWLSGIGATYRYNGTSAYRRSDLDFYTSGGFQARLDSAGRLGIGLVPAYKLDVAGTIHAATGQGVVLDAQDRPIITRGWDPFTSGNYNGLGRWGLFMEPFNLTLGVPEMVGRNFQWATYNLNSTVARQLMLLTQTGYLGIGQPTPQAMLQVARGAAPAGTAAFEGTNRTSHFSYSTAEDTYIRGGKAASNVILNDNGGGVAIGTTTVTSGELLDVNGSTRTTEVHTPATGASNMLALAYGQVNSGAVSIANSSGNVSVSKIGTGHYRLTFSGLGAVSFDVLSVALSLNGSTAGFISSEGLTGGPGTLDVYTYGSNGNSATDRNFSFAVYRP